MLDYPEQVVEAVRLRLSIDRWTLAEVSAEVGITRRVLIRIAEQHGIDRPSRVEALRRSCLLPDIAARKRAGVQRAAEMRRSVDSVRVPYWVPVEMTRHYVEVARVSGEEAAASSVRYRKKQAARVAAPQ